MAQQPIRMTEGFRNAKIKAGQLTEADADGHWQMPPNISAESQDDFQKTLQGVSMPLPSDQAE